VNEVEDAEGKDEDKGTDEQAHVQMQVARDEIKASHQEGLRLPKAARGSGRATDTVALPTATANEHAEAADLERADAER
jgi:hypothetical protein